MAIRSGGPGPGVVRGTNATHERVRLAIVEATEGVASPEMAKRIVNEALAAAGLDQPPTRSSELARFARGQLRRALSVVLGRDAADVVEEAVLAIASRLDGAPAPGATRELLEETTGVRWTDRPDTVVGPDAHATTPPTPVTTSASDRTILVATTDALRVTVIERAAKTKAAIARVDDLMSLIDAAQSEAGAGLLVIVDCLAPSVQLPTLAIVAPDLPRGARVVLWGISDDGWLELASIAGESELRRFARADVGDAGVHQAVRRFIG